MAYGIEDEGEPGESLEVRYQTDADPPALGRGIA